MSAQITLVPLASLVLAPENARHGVDYDPAAITALAVSITALDGLIEPLKAYQDGDQVAVWDGGRRLAALKGYVSLPPGLEAGIPVIITSRGEADLASLATFIREDMHPADRFLKWSEMFDRGHSPDMIAAACGVSTREVAQLLRFRMLAPEVLEAYRAGRMDFDAALAFTVTDNHERQKLALEAQGEGPIYAYHVKNALMRGSVRADDRRARWVGRDAYEAAGGRFLVDLFSHREIDETWQDVDKLQRLYDEKLAALVEEIGQEGWSDVLVSEDAYGWANGFTRMEPEGEDGVWSADQLAQGVAIVVFNYQGEPDIKRGWSRIAKVKPTGDALPPAKAKPGLYGFSHEGHKRMTVVATTAVQSAVAADPALAYDAMVAQLAWVGVQPWGNHSRGPSKLGINYNDRPKALASDVRERLEAWRDRLPSERPAFVAAVAALSADDKADLLALSYAASLDAIEDKVTATASDARQEIGWLARRAGVDFAAVWTPDADFLKGASKDALLAVIKELTPREADRWADAKKGAMVEYVAQKAEALGWTPQLLRDLLVEPEAPKAEKPARKGRKAKAQVEADADADASETAEA
jgi:ParB family transcriptional regulator, chromosome partitioning protein